MNKTEKETITTVNYDKVKNYYIDKEIDEKMIIYNYEITINPIDVAVKKLHQDAILPKYAHIGDAGCDLYTLEDTIIKANQTKAIKTGIALELPQNFEAQIRPRSGISLNGCRNCYKLLKDIEEFDKISNIDQEDIVKSSPYLQVLFGTVDSGYRDDVSIITWNREDYDVIIPKGTRLAQMVIKRNELVQLVEVDNLSESDRGANGFGSSGLK